MISEHQKYRVCARIRDELPEQYGRLLLEEMDVEKNNKLLTVCPWKESFQFRWELYFYLFLANDGYQFMVDELPTPPMECPYHPWRHGLVPSEIVMLAHVGGRLEELWLNTGVNPQQMNDIVDEYKAFLMEWHDEDAAVARMHDIAYQTAKALRDTLNEIIVDDEDEENEDG